ncbi:hypothetical protein PCANC_04252 [Puccinia coronata f. sp. avenae]|jgi:ribosomal protein L30|uniref:Large ribosomal subunit protein uL30m n=1 Tax=Puccinia coronata f. sp. avenae TaxID=200324 RepID=A0A2N5V328_9BASI|nr:hypothetical protein PCANC_20646 [Puccinia coronata f. sp. avenae]PLW22124.1 hypothetical protein PCASD_15116 [Puccinia coronata f. sp. avenae]PLW44419.1 hypothetical protein PCASD_04509 [Puccinia coronata f. sp. avenae]PLW54576.1 hypothetical protein PCANC_04252 [Puccinia coronata f. sp. avenae]
MFSALARTGRRRTGAFRFTRCCEYSTEVDERAGATSTPHPTPTSEAPQTTTHYRVTLYRSPIGLPKRRHDSLASLGLRKRMDVAYHRHSPDAAGLILSVKELLKVENVSEEEVTLGQQSSRKLLGDDRGYRLIRNVLDRD